MKTLLGSCTKHKKDKFEKTPMYRSLLKDSIGDANNDYTFYEGDVNAVIKTSNKDNIGKHYNRVIKMGVDEGYDCVILMHDDVSVEDSFLRKKLETAFKEYDVVGIAGAKNIQIKEPALWHLMCNVEDWSGSVAHPEGPTQIKTTYFGPTPARCLVLDGLFMAIKVSSITDDIRFDENIPAIAHHYDIDFCLNANKHGLKLTTWPIWCVHQSPGLSNFDQQFTDSQTYFFNKWERKN